MENKLKEETENLKKMRKQLEDMLEEIITMAKGNMEISHEIPGAIADMVKDLAEAEKYVADRCKSETEIEYKKKIIDAMDTSEFGKDYDEKGPLMGYRKMHYPENWEYPRDNYPVMGFVPADIYTGNMDSGNSRDDGRMGFKDSVQDISGRGKYYDTYREMRRHYTNTKTPDSQKKMVDSREKVFDELETIIMELWGDLDQSEKEKYMQKGQKMINRLQGML